ncbi:hypothetical protein SEUCBS140593_008559 [Sporothrix eucalyptigena]|uniref:Carboxylic ester hydrolase n=1 Tax=Sporothrix eucalyptigena TaxID=1812306 RepID=A0ABP0CQ28_9PEZI
MPDIATALQQMATADPRVRILHTQYFYPGDALVPSSQAASDASIRLANGVTLVKLYVRTTGSLPPSATPHLTVGTDVGIELWLPDAETWNGRLRVQIQGGFMGDAGVTAADQFAAAPCGSELPMGQLAADRGYVVASTDGGHVATTYEDTSYLLNADGTVNHEGFKNIAWRATRETARLSKATILAYYGRPQTYSYLFGCSTGGRQAYHSAQKYPADFDGYLAGCPSLTQSILFPSLIHPLIVVNNDLGGQPFKPGQLEMVSRKALTAGDTTVTGDHDGYITHWDDNTYDPTKDPTVLDTASGGTNTEPWALSIAQARAINKIWYGPTIDGNIPDPAVDNGSHYKLSPNQLWWGKIRGTRIDFAGRPRDIGGGWLANVFSDPAYASSLWNHPLGEAKNKWTKMTHKEFAEALLASRARDPDFENMDADYPDLREAQRLGKKILTYHAIGDTGVAPQSSVRYYEASSAVTGGLAATQAFHRLFLIPGMGHCTRYRGVAGYVDPPMPTLEEMFDALVAWVERGEALDHLDATSVDGKLKRRLYAYPKSPRHEGGKGAETTSKL